GIITSSKITSGGSCAAHSSACRPEVANRTSYCSDSTLPSTTKFAGTSSTMRTWARSNGKLFNVPYFPQPDACKFIINKLARSRRDLRACLSQARGGLFPLCFQRGVQDIGYIGRDHGVEQLAAHHAHVGAV